VPPDNRPIPRFIADNSQEGIPYGRFAETLAGHFREAVARIEDLPEGVEAPQDLVWFPERTWGGRVWHPVTARTEGPDGPLELFGHVSHEQVRDEGDPSGFRVEADFTDVLAEDNPDWRIDLNDDVIGRWRGENDRAGSVTLIWGRPLVQGAVAATGELEGKTVDQTPVVDRSFTLIALDALEAYGDDVYLDIKLFNRRAVELASESLYAEAEPEEPEVPSPEEPR
jgi:hypothetical protein